MSRIEEIYEAVLPEMKALGIEDTMENRLAFLTGIKDGWQELPEAGDDEFEKLMYRVALSCEIWRLETKMAYAKVKA